MKIGVDLISGESPLEDLISGCLDALKEEKDIDIVIIGQSNVYRNHLDKKLEQTPSIKNDLKRISIMDASEVITMHDDPLTVMKQKKDSSIIKGLNAHKNGEIDAFFSPGNTGAIVVASSLILGRVKGVKKPALAMYFPNIDERANIVLDVGASAECDVDDFVKFSIMGRTYAQEMLSIPNPRIGLLNIGEESHKGTSVLKNTHKRLHELNLNFVGNVEGRDLFTTKADVIVCDGHIGNVALKTAEGAGDLIFKLLKRFIKADIIAALSTPLYKKALKKMQNSLDPELYGGAPLLGVNGNVFIGHGSSGRVAIKCGIQAAAHAVRSDVLGKINHKMKEFHLA